MKEKTDEAVLRLQSGYGAVCPTVDAVPVVRCGKCKYFVPFVEPYNKVGQCKRKMAGLVIADDFCSYGERRSDD